VSYALELRAKAFHAGDRFQRLSPVPHLHRHMELVYLTRGAGMAVADQWSGRLEPGDVYLAFPNQIHFFEDIPARGFVFIVLPDLFPDLEDIFSNRLPRCPVIRKKFLPPDLPQRLETICRCANSGDRLEQVMARGYMQALLAQLLQHMELAEAGGNQDSVKRVLLFCSEHYRQPITLEQAARRLHLSGDYISHLFTHRIGIHFPDFINDLRVEHVCSLLTPGCSVTEVAYESGFSSIRSFNRNFRRRMGTSPSEYIKNKTDWSGKTPNKAAGVPAGEKLQIMELNKKNL